jgi:hypothetical protein
MMANGAGQLPAGAKAIGQTHDFGGALVQTQVYQDPTNSNPATAFWVQITTPVKTFVQQLTNGQMVSVPLTGVTLDGIVDPTLNFEVTDFSAGTGSPGQRKLTFNIRIRIRAIFWLQVGLIPVSATY